MRNSKIIEFDGKEITVKELMVSELDALLGQDDHVPSWLDRILDKDLLTGAVLSKSVGMSVADLSAMTPSSLRPLIDACKEVNPDFLETARLEVARAEKMEETLGSSLGAVPVS